MTFGGNVREGKPTEMQPLINQMIGFDYETFVNTTVYSQETSQMLGAATDANRRKIFAKLLNLDRFTRAWEVSKAKMKELVEIQEKNIQTMELFKTKMEMLNEEVAQHEEYAAAFDKNQKARLEQAQKDLAAIPKKKRIKAIKRQYANLVAQYDETKAEALAGNAPNLLADLRIAQRKKQELEESLVKQPDKCPTCGRKYTKSQREAFEKDVMDHIKGYDEEIADKQRRYDEAKEVVDTIEPIRSQMTQAGMDIDRIERSNEQIDKDTENALKAIKGIEAQKNTHHELAAKAREAIVMMQKDYDNAKADHDITRDIINDWDFVSWLYSPKGAPTYIIENSFEYIQNQANYYLMILTGGSFEIKLESEREIKGGKKKEEIHLRIYHNGKEMRYNNASDGQRQRINIALLFAINALCRSQGNLDFLLLDEVLDLSLDETGQERVLALLREISREVGTIFVISHKKGIADNFDSVLNIVHENGVSKVI
ncbi:MAG: hypothetical protein GTN80_03710 [Nitrososphaeria archaeon]|nr:hypothetical protein [Nitrososphaeria archaeon]NIQ32738.1 hypothetical protein [Nitrososphaeria archaeon]